MVMGLESVKRLLIVVPCSSGYSFRAASIYRVGYAVKGVCVLGPSTPH